MISYIGARSFVRASTQSFSYPAAVVTAVPLTLACRFKLKSMPTGGVEWVLLALGNTGRNDRFWIAIGDPNSTQVYCDATNNGVIYRKAKQNAGLATGVWYDAVATYSTSGVSEIYFNNVTSNVSSGTVQVPGGLNDTRIGAFKYSGGDYGASDAVIADAAIYNTDLSVNEVALYTGGLSPLSIRRGNLVAYWPFINGDSTDVIGRRPMTNNGGVGYAPHPPNSPVVLDRQLLYTGMGSGSYTPIEVAG